MEYTLVRVVLHDADNHPAVTKALAEFGFVHLRGLHDALPTGTYRYVGPLDDREQIRTVVRRVLASISSAGQLSEEIFIDNQNALSPQLRILYLALPQTSMPARCRILPPNPPAP